jgi:SAM-dependent methyltransferase
MSPNKALQPTASCRDWWHFGRRLGRRSRRLNGISLGGNRTLVEVKMGTATEDGSNGYEAVATIYIAGRGSRPHVGDSIGAAVVKAWAGAFPSGATVLDLGSGPGEPSTRILQEAGLTTYAVDASPTMVAAFRERFPGVPVERKSVEASEFFNQTFDGVLAWGLLFLLDPAAQALVIEKVAHALNPGGRFLFTAPKEPIEWLDGMTDRQSQSLGAQTYERLLRDAGLTWVADAQDEGENYYYVVEKL